MKLFFRSLFSSLLFLAVVAEAGTENEHFDLIPPVAFLGMDFSLQLSQDGSHSVVGNDGYIHFMLDVPEQRKDFINNHHLQINVPYFSNGHKKNHYIEVSEAGLIPISIPSEEPPGTPIYLSDGDRRFAKSTAEWLLRPIIQFFMFYKVLGYVGGTGDMDSYGPYIDFKNGAFVEGVLGYFALDNVLRLAQDTRERLEVYYPIGPDGSSMTVVGMFYASVLVLRRVPVDFARFNALSMHKSFIYSVIAEGIVNTLDVSQVTPKVAEKWFPSHGSVRNTESKWLSQFFRGPILFLGLSRLDYLGSAPGSDPGPLSPANWLIAHKLMIRSAFETTLLTEMIGQNKTEHFGAVEGKFIEWLIHGATAAACIYAKVPPGSLKQTFTGEFQQRMGAHSHKDVRHFKDHIINNKKLSRIDQVFNKAVVDFAIGALMYMAAYEVDTKMGGSGKVANLVGKGIGLSYAVKSLGCIMEWVAGCASEFAHDLFAADYPEVASFFRKDYIIEINHGLTPGPKPEPEQPSGSQPQPIRDEL